MECERGGPLQPLRNHRITSHVLMMSKWGTEGISRSIGAPIRSAERYGQGKSALTGFFVLTVHVLGGLSH